MKTFTLLIFLLSLSTAYAEQSCTVEYDGTIYRISTMADVQIEEGLVIDQVTPYNVLNYETRKSEIKYAKVQYKVLKFEEVENTPANCKGVGTGFFDYDRNVTAVKFEASSADAIFGSPTDGANTKGIKAWAICKGLHSRECK